MATKNSALRNKMAEDFGALFNSGKLIIKDSGGNTLATFSFSAAAFGAAASGKIELADTPISATASGTGTAATADMESSTGTYKLTGLTVGTSAAHVIIDNTSIASGQTVNLNALDWTEDDEIV